MIQLIHVSDSWLPISQSALIAMSIAFSACFISSVSADPAQKRWQIGTPIVTYWAGPPAPIAWNCAFSLEEARW